MFNQFKNIDELRNKIFCDDCLTFLQKNVPDNSIDSIVTDPPYGLEFMGKDWDKFKQGKNIGGSTSKGTPFDRQEYKGTPSFYQLSYQDKLFFQEFSFNYKIVVDVR